MRIRDRLRSWAVWLSVFGALGVVFNSLGVFEKLGIDSAAWNVCVNALGSVLIAFGILNNPTDRENF